MTYNPDNPTEHEYDPYEDAMTDPPSFFFGQVTNRAWPIIGSRPPGMEWKGNTTIEDYVEELHGPMAEVKRDPDKFIATTVEFSLTPVDPTRKIMTRKMSAGKREFREVVRPSIEALGNHVAEVKNLVPGQFNLLQEFADLWVKGELVPSPDNKAGETWKTWKFLQVYANQAECKQAADEMYNNHNEADKVPDEQSAEDATKAALVPFLYSLWEQAKRQTEKTDGTIIAEDVLAGLLATNPLLAKVFTMESYEVQTIINADTEDENERPREVNDD